MQWLPYSHTRLSAFVGPHTVCAVCCTAQAVRCPHLHAKRCVRREGYANRRDASVGSRVMSERLPPHAPPLSTTHRPAPALGAPPLPSVQPSQRAQLQPHPQQMTQQQGDPDDTSTPLPPRGSSHSGRPDVGSSGRGNHGGPPITLLSAAVPLSLQAPPAFRYWLDEVLWSQGYPSVELLDRVLMSAGGQRTGGPPRPIPTAPRSGPVRLGWEQPDQWELLWTKSTYALRAVRSLRPGQIVSVIVGLNSLTMKKRMLQTLKAAYGPEAAACITPLSFALPEELPQWRAHIARTQSKPAQPAQPSQPQSAPAPASSGHASSSSAVNTQSAVNTSASGTTSHSPAATNGHASRSSGVSAVNTSGASASSSASHGAKADPINGHTSSSSGVTNCQSLSQTEPLWILKTGQDAGKGLQLLPASEALQTAESEARQLASGADIKHPLQVAQDYVSNPLLLEGRKCHLRLWVLVTRHNPLQAYVHRRGLVLFSSEPYQPTQPWSTHQHEHQPMQPNGTHTLGQTSTDTETDTVAQQQQRPAGQPHDRGSARVVGSAQVGTSTDARTHTQQQQQGSGSSTEAAAAAGSARQQHGKIAAGHLTNLACNSSGLVWPLSRLEGVLGEAAWGGLWAAMQRSLRLAMRAAWAPMQEAHAWLRPPFPDYGYQLLGVDFLVDTNLRPWLLEFNSSPSIMALHDDPATASMIRDEKSKMLEDMFAMIAHRVYPVNTQYRTGSGAGAAGKAKESSGAAPVGEWVPL